MTTPSEPMSGAMSTGTDEMNEGFYLCRKLREERNRLRAEVERLNGELHELRKSLAWIDGDRADAEKERDDLRAANEELREAAQSMLHCASAKCLECEEAIRDALREGKEEG